MGPRHEFGNSDLATVRDFLLRKLIFIQDVNLLIQKSPNFGVTFDTRLLARPEKPTSMT